MKRFLAVFLMLAILLTGLTVTASAANTGWVKDGDEWYYYKADGTMVTSDWVQSSGKWYYLGEDGVMVADGVREINEKWYGFDKNGAMAANNWYEVKWIEGTGSYWFYAGADGAFVKGWKQIGGKWYYFYGANTFDKDSYWPAMATGDYFWDWDEAIGEYVSLFDNGAFYAFRPSGEMIVGWGQPYNNVHSQWVYGNADGSLVVKSWKKIGGKWYYFDDTGWMYRNGPKSTLNKNDKNIYLFNNSGALVENGWYQPYEVDEKGEVYKYSWYYGGKDGVVQKGWLKDKGNWYYLDAEWGNMRTGLIEMTDGKTYYLDETTGAMVTGWKQLDNIWYYFKDSGAMAVKEWVKSGSAWYYLKEDGQMAKDEILTIDGKPYKFDANGVWVP